MNITAEARQMREIRRVLHMVDCIYAAACGEISWGQMVSQVCELGKLDGCILSMVDRLERRRIVLASCGLGSNAELKAMLGLTLSDTQLLDCLLQASQGPFGHEFRMMSETPLPNTTLLLTDGVQPTCMRSWACLIVDKEERQVGYLEVYAGAGQASGYPEPADLLRQLAPHLNRAWRLAVMGESTLQRDAKAFLGARRSAALAVAESAADLAALPEVARLRAEFGLTKAEARLALHLAEGSSLLSAAQAFDVKLTTIRSQLKQVFLKTATCRQAAFVALLRSRGYGSTSLSGLLKEPSKVETAVAG